MDGFTFFLVCVLLWLRWYRHLSPFFGLFPMYCIIFFWLCFFLMPCLDSERGLWCCQWLPALLLDSFQVSESRDFWATQPEDSCPGEWGPSPRGRETNRLCEPSLVTDGPQSILMTLGPRGGAPTGCWLPWRILDLYTQMHSTSCLLAGWRPHARNGVFFLSCVTSGWWRKTAWTEGLATHLYFLQFWRLDV